jgi:hypothetical protein
MGFLDHLEELRKRIVYSAIAVAIGFFACWGYAERIYGVMQRPIMDALARNNLSAKLVYVNPTEPFNLYLKVGMMAGLFVASPFVLYQLWCFISPGLYRNEKRYVLPFMVSTIGSVSRRRILWLQSRPAAGAGLPHRLRQRLSADDHAHRIQFAVPDHHRRPGHHF